MPAFQVTDVRAAGSRASARGCAPRALGSAFVTIFVALACGAGARADPLESIVESLKASEIRFPRASSNVPLPRIAVLQAVDYGATELRLPESIGGSLKVDQTMLEQGAAVPIFAGRRDLFLVGEWLSYADFDSHASGFDSFHVLTVGVPVGWLHQSSEKRQIAAFAFPLAHKASLPRASWSYEAMMGLFGRYVQTDDFWWVFGVFADIGAIDDYVLPYVGASWNLNEEWTLSAILPWPAVSYAPRPDVLFRLGASPSGTSWTLDAAHADVAMNLSTWDLGLSASYRVHGNVWVSIEAGVGGFGGLSISDSGVDGPDLESRSSGYVTVGIGYRPSADF
jgi:hypothetical protein